MSLREVEDLTKNWESSTLKATAGPLGAMCAVFQDCSLRISPNAIGAFGFAALGRAPAQECDTKYTEPLDSEASPEAYLGVRRRS